MLSRSMPGNSAEDPSGHPPSRGSSRPTRIRLRQWQSDALDKFWASERSDFLAVATPGAGKTTFALAAAVQYLMDDPAGVVIVVAPTAHLKAQWTAAAAALRLHLDPGWSAQSDGQLNGIAPDMHGIVTTYQQVSTSARALRAISGNAFVILDEVHHAGDDRSWGSALVAAFSGAPRRLSLSGTPFRSDTSAIPFVDYHLDEATADYTYGYAEALADRAVVRPVYFPRVGGFMEWVAPDGSELAATFEDELGREKANQRLRTALSLEGNWLPDVLAQADERLMEIRRTHPAAGALVVATDQNHARGIGDLLRRRGREVVVATSDDPRASSLISGFAEGDAPWIVAVRMVSEGVDIPRLRIAVHATTTTTELFFRQVVGRVVRWTRGEGAQKAYVFIPDDPRLRRWAASLAEHRKHCIARRGRGNDEGAPEGLAQETGEPEQPTMQLTMFEVIGAVATGSEESPGAGIGVFDDAHDDVTTMSVVTDPPGIDLVLAPPSRLGRGPAADTSGDPFSEAGASGVPPSGIGASRSAQKAQLKAANSAVVASLVEATGVGHSAVNAELNRLAGITRVSAATVGELEKRLDAGRDWLRRA